MDATPPLPTDMNDLLSAHTPKQSPTLSAHPRHPADPRASSATVANHQTTLMSTFPPPHQ